MYDVSCKLLSASYTNDDIGNEIATIKEIEIPIIKVETVKQGEFYNASQQGLKPSLQLRVSTLNYNDEENLRYMGITYSIIRTQNLNCDEMILICERKEGNGN
jgi:SPP1 family predicted phage head-tail adaptor